MFDITLIAHQRLSPSTLAFVFQRDDGQAVECAPGQFFRFVFTDAQGEFERSYSLCHLSATQLEAGQLRLVVSAVTGGRATQLLFAAGPGLRARVTGPFGRLVLPDSLPDRVVLVAASVGLAPYLPMLEVLDAAMTRQQCDVALLLGVRSPDEFLYSDELIALNKRHERFDLRVCYSRQQPEQPREFEHAGYVQAQFVTLQPDPERDLFMLCGNPGMIDEAFDLLKQQGFKSRQVLREKYVFAKRPLSVEGAGSNKTAMSEAQKKLLAEKMRKYAR